MENDPNQPNQPTQPEKTRQKNGSGKEAWEWIKSLAIALLLAFLIRQFAFAIFMVDGGSMVPSFQDHERLIVNKIVYHIHKPEYGDVVIFKPPFDTSKDFIKRVIGLPGDKIEVKDYKVFRNGKELNEPYINEPTKPSDQVYTVPPGTMFVMGDNRNNSKDSRDPQVGYVPFDNIDGRAELVWWPLSDMRVIHTPKQ